MPLPHSISKTEWPSAVVSMQIETADLDLARRNVDGLAFAGEIVGAFAADLDGGELRRRLHDDAGIFRQQRADLGFVGPLVRGFRHRAFEIVGRALLAPGDGEAVDLRAVHDVGHGLRRLAERDRQHAGRQRIERAGMSGLLGLEQPLDLGDGLGRAHADRLVEDQPAGDRPALFLAAAGHHSSSLSSSLSRSRATSGERSSSSILATYCRSWYRSRKRNSGMYRICRSAGRRGRG